MTSEKNTELRKMKAEKAESERDEWKRLYHALEKSSKADVDKMDAGIVQARAERDTLKARCEKLERRIQSLFHAAGTLMHVIEGLPYEPRNAVHFYGKTRTRRTSKTGGREMTYEDTIGMAHIVILENAEELKVIEFEGKDAAEQAHALAVAEALTGKYITTVTVRIRCCGGFSLAKNLNHQLAC